MAADPTPAAVTVRAATARDLDAIIDLLEAVAAEGRWLATEAPVDRERRRRSMAALIGDGGSSRGTAFVADAGAAGVVGSLGLELTPYGVAELGMMVAAAWRRQGVGRALMDAAAAWARDAGAHKVALEVWPHNQAARALYRRMGFAEEGYLRCHYPRRSGERWDVVVMGLLLTPCDPPDERGTTPSSATPRS